MEAKISVPLPGVENPVVIGAKIKAANGANGDRYETHLSRLWKRS